MNFIIYLLCNAHMESHQNYSLHFLASPGIFIKLEGRDEPKSPGALTELFDGEFCQARDTLQGKYRPS